MTLNILGATLSNNPTLEGRSDYELVTGVQVVQESIATLFDTEAANPETGAGGERVYNRNVGLNLKQFLFRNDDAQVRAAIKAEALKINEFEPRQVTSPEGVRVVTDASGEYRWKVFLTFTLLATNTQYNFVVPLFKRGRYGEVKQ